MPRPVSPTVHRAAQSILRWLRQHPAGGTKAALAEATAVSTVTVQRALLWLRDHQDAPIVFERPENHWRLTDATFSLPMFDPVPRDLQAVLFASSLLEPLADKALSDRLHRLVEEMDQRVRDSATPLRLRPGTVTATISQGQPIALEVLDVLLRAVGRHTVTFEYQSPWATPGPAKRYEVEPWQLRIHDNRVYLRGFTVNRNAPRSFRVAFMRDVRPLENVAPTHAIPPTDRIWDDGDPAFGVDHDRPDVATIRMSGAVARWAALEQWHDEQVDRWIEPAELLERRVPYASCREFARRLMTVADGLVDVEPAELREQVAALAASAARLGSAQ